MNNTLDFTYSDVHKIMLDIYGGDPYSPRSGPTMHAILMSMLTTMQTSKWGSASADYLNGNPWWATNSAFVSRRQYMSAAYPDEAPPKNWTFSFPQQLSQLFVELATPVNKATDAAIRQQWLDWWGRSAQAYAPQDSTAWFHQTYTWFDWVADMLKTNFNSTSFSSYYDLTNEVGRPLLPVEDEEDMPTNAPLPEFSNFRSDFQHAIANPPNFSAAVQFDVDLQSPTDGDPAFVVIPSLTAGGVSLSASVFSFADLPPYVRIMVPAVMAWLWRVLFVVALWHLVKVEFGFWSTLGNSEGGA